MNQPAGAGVEQGDYAVFIGPVPMADVPCGGFNDYALSLDCD